MVWLAPSVIATMVGTAVLAICYYYLYLQDRQEFLKIWAISWSIYFTRYLFMLGIIFWKKAPFLLICNQLVTLLSGVLLLYGSHLFVQKSFPKPFYLVAVAGAAWIVVSVVNDFSFMLMSLPTFSFLAVIYIWTGVIFFKSNESYRNESRIVGMAFIIWGIHKANYPFLRPVVWIAPWGYLLAAILELIVALGLIMVYFRKTRDELYTHEMKLHENQKRLEEAQRIAKVGDWSWEMETDTLKWSDETYRIFGHNPQDFEVSVEAFEKAIHPDDYDEFVSKRDSALSRNEDIDIEHRIVLPDGRVRHVHEVSVLTRDQQDKIVKVVGTVQDVTERKLFETELAETKEKFEKFFNTNPSPTFVWKKIDGDFELTEVNESAQNMTERKAGDFLGLTASEIYKDLPFMIEKLCQCLREESVLEFEHHYKVRHSGEYEWVTFRMAFMYPDVVLMYTEVVTQQKKAQEALIQAGKKWKNILVNTPQIGISLNTKAEIVFTNEQFLKLTGWTHDQVIGKNWFDLFIPKNIREDIRKVFDDTMNQVDTYDYSNYENEILTKSGELRTISWSNVISRDGSGNITDITCLGVDLTERKKAENEIEQQKRLFETMFNTIPDGVVITDTNRKILLANKGMENIFGYAPDELLGKKTNILYADIKKIERTGTYVSGKSARVFGDLYVTRYRDKNGREFSGETFGARLYDEDYRWIGNLGIMRDITEREQAELRIQQAQKMESIGNLAGGIAHDFNNILFPIIGIAEMLIEDLSPGTTEYEYAKDILRAGHRGSALVQQILSFSRQHEQKKAPVGVQRVIAEVLKLSRSTIPMNIEIKQSLQSDCGFVMADSTQLHQIGMNLITNAYHAVQDKGGEIFVEVKEVFITKSDNELDLPIGRYARLMVADNGTGIPEDHLDKIFEPYFTTKEQGRGTGLGLSVVYGIVKEHGGDIRAVSEPDAGSTFQVFLPIIDSPATDKKIVEDAVLPNGNEHILLVDDELPIMQLMKLLLERLGYTVSARNSSADALEAFKQKPNGYDLVVTDMAMPYMTGKELAMVMMGIRPDIPIILCTGFSERFNEDAAKAIGIKGFLMKPIVRSDLAKEVRKVLDSV